MQLSAILVLSAAAASSAAFADGLARHALVRSRVASPLAVADTPAKAEAIALDTQLRNGDSTSVPDGVLARNSRGRACGLPRELTVSR